MSLYLFSSGTCTPEEVTELTPLPSWRRSSKCMIMASIASERAIANCQSFNFQLREDVALVVGSVSGELETTAEFLLTLNKENMARPMLFQNSLHNATAGFVAISQKLLGASFTLSAGLSTPVECLRMAETLIAESVCKICLVVLTEVNQLMTDLLHLRHCHEGAVAMLVGSEPLADSATKLDMTTVLNLAYSPPLLLTDPRVDIVGSPIWNLAREKSS